jgi:hypothetical protein
MWHSNRHNWALHAKVAAHPAKAGLLLNEHLGEPSDIVFRYACKLGLEGIETARLALPLRPVAALGQEQESGMCGGEAGGRRGL